MIVQEASDAEHYKVTLIDSGKTLDVHYNYLRRLTHDFASRGHPAAAAAASGSTCFAVKCHLAGLAPSGEALSWPADVKQRLGDTIRGFRGQFVALRPDSGSPDSDGVILVHVRVDRSREEPYKRQGVATCINKLMVESGDAALERGRQGNKSLKKAHFVLST